MTVGGETVFEALDFDPNDPRIGWDGRLRGSFLNPAVFVFAINATLIDGRNVSLKGDVTLSR
ncbi:MAG: hypothetical protein HC821_00180 [Lewinella sp.]|nr:hypothetical protein [Lewinella sp.]